MPETAWCEEMIHKNLGWGTFCRDRAQTAFKNIMYARYINVNLNTVDF